MGQENEKRAESKLQGQATKDSAEESTRGARYGRRKAEAIEEEARKPEGRGKLQEASGKSKEDMEASKSKIQQQARDGRKLIITARTRKQRGRS